MGTFLFFNGDVPIVAAMDSKKNRNVPGFTLVELMVAVCILSIGLVGIARSLLSAVSALDYSNNLMQRMSFLDNAMCELEEKAEEKEFFKVEDQDIKDFLQEKYNEAEEKGIGSLTWDAAVSDAGSSITEFEFTLSWQEGSNEKSVSLVSYLASPAQKEQAEPPSP